MRTLPLVLFALSPSLVLAQGALEVASEDGTKVAMPLEHTRISIEVSAFVARATVEQTFRNPFEAPVEAVYTFPLGDRAAVDDFEMQIGERIVRGEVKRKEEARETYERARAAGYRAALLEQERPNVFTQSVANLLPGEPIVVRLRTVETLPYERGIYRLTFPLVVGPRYAPGSAATGPPVLPPGTRSGHDVEIEVSLDAGVPIAELSSPSHRILVERPEATRAVVKLDPEDTIPNKDFLLRWSVASEKPALGFLAHKDGIDGFFTLLVQPKGEVTPIEAAPKEITFVVDTSGSMSGVPIEASKRFIAAALHELGPKDTFDVIRFAGDNAVWSEDPRPNASADIEEAIRWLGKLRGAGGTELHAALRAAFARPADPNRVRIVVFATDGYVGDEADILGAIGEVLGDARIYTVGIGSSVNHHLLDRMADLGRGAYVFVRPDEKADDALEAFRSWVTRPYMTDLEVDWGGLPIADVMPERPRDLFSGQTLTIVGRCVGSGDGEVVVRGKLGGALWERRVRVAMPERKEGHAALSSLWARWRVEALLRETPMSVPDSVRAEVIGLALEHRLMTPYTSFVAVDESSVANPGGEQTTVQQALPLPEGVSLEGIFGSGGPEGLRSPIPPNQKSDVMEATIDVLPGTTGLTIRVLDATDKSPLSGVVITLTSTKGLVQRTAQITGGNGSTSFPALPAGGGYAVEAFCDGYARILVPDIRVRDNENTTIPIQMTPVEVEKVHLLAERPTHDVSATAPTTRDSDQFIRDLPIAGRHDEQAETGGVIGGVVGGVVGGVLGGVESEAQSETVTVSAERPMIDRSSTEWSYRFDLAAPTRSYTNTIVLAPLTKGAVEEVTVRRLEARHRVRDDALRLLADLADDGKLSPSAGTPALAALLAAQRSDGAMSSDVPTQALATWALAEAAARNPDVPWIVEASKRAATYLRSVSVEIHDPESTRWTRLALAVADPEGSLPTAPNGEPSEAWRKLASALAAPRNRNAAIVGGTAFERLCGNAKRGFLVASAEAVR